MILSTFSVKCHGQALGLDLRDINKKDTNERCVDKIVFVNETEYDEVITCDHIYSEKCHATFKTDFEPSQEQECSESFTKNCFIEFKDVATEEDIEFCHTPMVIKNHKLLSHTVWKLKKFSLTLFSQKFRETNGFTKEITK